MKIFAGSIFFIAEPPVSFFILVILPNHFFLRFSPRPPPDD